MPQYQITAFTTGRTQTRSTLVRVPEKQLEGAATAVAQKHRAYRIQIHQIHGMNVAQQHVTQTLVCDVRTDRAGAGL